MGDLNEYALEGKPLGNGGYAVVTPALHKLTGERRAFKRLRSITDKESKKRLRREIEVQSKLSHPNIMPILDADTNGEWFVMPLAAGDLKQLRPQLGAGEFFSIIAQAALGLRAAHLDGYVHRDVTPRNILALQEGAVRRWVVADWGLVRKPKGMTTSPLTLPGQMYGTEGFVAPEVDDDAHEADARVDVYSLGRVAAWLLTGTWPKQNIALVPQDPKWRRLVEAMTDAEPALRLENMDQVLWMLDVEFNPSTTVIQKVGPLMKHVGENLSVAALIMRYSRDFADDHNLFFDYVPRIPQEAVARFIRTDPGTVQAVVSAMLNHILAMTDWGHRDFNELNISMGWLETVARAAESVPQLGVLEATASALFTADARHERYSQRHRTRAWLNSLQGEAAAVVARALKANPKAVQWYLNEGWSPHMHADQRIRQALSR